MHDPNELSATILRLLHARRPSASICPSEVARATGRADWRDLMPAVRDAARALAAESVIEITQRGAVIAPDAPLRGPIRLRFARPPEPGADL
jgi:hypothetical protein